MDVGNMLLPRLVLKVSMNKSPHLFNHLKWRLPQEHTWKPLVGNSGAGWKKPVFPNNPWERATYLATPTLEFQLSKKQTFIVLGYCSSIEAASVTAV